MVYSNTADYGGGGGMSMLFSVTCIFSLFEALNAALEVQFFQGFMFTPHHRH